MTHGDCASSHASATCWRADAALGGDLGEGRVVARPVPWRHRARRAGSTGRKARPSSAHTSISGRLLRKAGENWFCTLTSPSPITLCASRIWSGFGVGEAHPGDLAGVVDLLEGADDVLVGHLGIGPVVLPERDLLDAQPLAGWRRRPRAGARRELSRAHAPSSARTCPPLVASTTSSRRPSSSSRPAIRRSLAPCAPAPELVTRPVGVGRVEQGDARIDRRPHRLGQLLARLGAGLVERHQAEADGADAQSADGVVPELSCVHDVIRTRPGNGRRAQTGRRSARAATRSSGALSRHASKVSSASSSRSMPSR